MFNTLYLVVNYILLGVDIHHVAIVVGT